MCCPKRPTGVGPGRPTPIAMDPGAIDIWASKTPSTPWLRYRSRPFFAPFFAPFFTVILHRNGSTTLFAYGLLCSAPLFALLRPPGSPQNGPPPGATVFLGLVPARARSRRRGNGAKNCALSAFAPRPASNQNQQTSLRQRLTLPPVLALPPLPIRIGWKNELPAVDAPLTSRLSLA